MTPAKLLVLPLVLAGCVDPADNLGTETDDIVGGYVTTVHAEVGMVVTGSNTCTGTLISERVVLTAAQCLSLAYTGAYMPVGSTFQFVDRTGVARSYALHESMSFYPQADVALIHLMSAVPAAEAIPAIVSATPPLLGDASTSFGYGCNSLVDGSGGGKKRTASFVYGQTTSSLCWGDSGGPVFFGSSASTSGALWGINIAHTPDQFAIAADLLAEIDAGRAYWDSTYDTFAFDRPGMDYALTSAGNGDVCAGYCAGDTRCQAWSFVPATLQCYLKDGVPEPVVNPAVESGIVRGTAGGYDRPGYDAEVITYAAGQGGVAACQNACADLGYCKAFSYVPSTRQCWLKDAVPAQVPNASVVSGLPATAHVYEVGYDRPGADLRQTQASTVNACAATCANDNRCRAFVWSATRTAPSSSNNCWLKTAAEPALASPAFTAGVRRGLTMNMAYGNGNNGQIYSTFTVTAPLWPAQYSNSPSSSNVFVCQSACAVDHDCAGWSFKLESNNTGTCSLMSNVGSGQTTVRSIAGVKGYEFSL